MTFEGHFSCRNHFSTNTSVTYYAPDLRREGALKGNSTFKNVWLKMKIYV